MTRKTWRGLAACVVVTALSAGLVFGQEGGGARRGGRGAGRGPGGGVQPVVPVAPATPWTPAKPAPLPAGMEDYKTVENCATTTLKRTRESVVATEPGYLGITTENKQGKLTVMAVALDSPASKAGIAVDDVVVNVDGHVPGDVDDLRDMIQGIEPGTMARVALARKGAALTVSALVTAVSRPMSLVAPNERPTLGVGVSEEGAARITRVDAGSAGARAGLRVGDVIVKVDEISLGDAVKLSDALMDKRVNDTVALLVDRGGEQATLLATLAAAGGGRRGAAAGGAGGNSTFFDRVGTLWRKETLRLAVIGIEYPDVKHSPRIENKAWEDEFFSKGIYRQPATGGTAYGSVNDFFQEVSYGKLRVEGKVFPWVTVAKNRGDYSLGTGTGAQNRTLLTEAVEALSKRDGGTALDGYDSIIFIYAGARVNTTRGSVYWPHKSNVNVGQRRMSYLIIPEMTGAQGGRGQRGGGATGTGGAGGVATTTAPGGGTGPMTDISVVCHESGHVLGLPDLYARPEDPGSEGLGRWCLMSQQAPNGQPQHMSAWCKEQLGWISPAVIDPAVKQKLVLGPIEDSPKECFKVLLKADGSEYFLLENRQKKGFDTSVPAAGLLIWRVTNNRPSLEESHGVDGPQGPGSFIGTVPFPSSANDSFTPFTTPSSRSKLGGGSQVYITNIKKMADGRVSFWIGYDFQ